MVKYSGVKSLLEYYLSQPIHSSDSLNFLDSCGGLVIPSGRVRTFKLSRDIRGIQSYSEVDGTSFSAPHVAGVAVLMRQAADLSNISLTPAEIESIMKRTGKPIYDSAASLTFPRIDAYRSVMSVLYDVFVNNLDEIYTDDTGKRIFEFSIYNDYGDNNITVNYTMDFGDGNSFNSSNFNMSPGINNETLVYAEHTYTGIGTYDVSVNIRSSGGSVSNQSIQVAIEKPNLRVYNLSVLNSSGLSRVFEFKIQNNSTKAYSNITWQLNISSDNPLNSTKLISLGANETIFVYAYYLYGESGSHNVTAAVDYDGRHHEFNETDNSVTITDG